MSFWEEKSLADMSREEWESLCDHCGKCCLTKLEDDDEAGSVYYTNIICDLFDESNGHCSDYWNREKRVPTCLRLTQDNLNQIEWLPPSCAYRSIMEGRGLPSWHHLISGSKQSIHDTGNSVLGKIVFDKDINDNHDEDYPYEEHIVEWPLN